MPIQSTTPIVVDGIEYPYYTVNLAISALPILLMAEAISDNHFW